MPYFNINSNTKTTGTFDLLHADILGLCSIPSLLKHGYFLTLVDIHSIRTWIIVIKSKNKLDNILSNLFHSLELNITPN